MKTNLLLKLNLGIVIFLFLLSACSRTIDGIQMVREKESKSSQTITSRLSKHQIIESKSEMQFDSNLKTDNKKLTASVEESIPEIKRDLAPTIANNSSDNFKIDWSGNNLEECDLIVLKTGEEVSAKVTEVGFDEIKYKRCDNLSGPTYSVYKTDVFMIKYSNGTKDVFSLDNSSNNNSSQQNNNSNTNQSLQNSNVLATHWGAITGLICSLVGLLAFGVFFGLLGIIFGSVAQTEIRKHPEKYKGNSMANAAVIIGVLGIILWLGILLMIYNGLLF